MVFEIVGHMLRSHAVSPHDTFNFQGLEPPIGCMPQSRRDHFALP
jgi:hypothetical protein